MKKILLQPVRKFLLEQAMVLAAIALAATAGSAKAAPIEIIFGSLTPAAGSGTCFSVGGGNSVCHNNLIFTNNGSTFTATGFDTSGAQSALTLRTGSLPSIDESGIGENAAFTGTPTACSDSDCEAAEGTFVTLNSTHAIEDVLIGSVQTPERFDIIPNVGPSILNVGYASSVCLHPAGTSATCEILLPTGTTNIELADLTGVGGDSDILIAGVSQEADPPPAPEPTTLTLLGTGLLGLAMMRRRKLSRAAARSVTHVTTCLKL